MRDAACAHSRSCQPETIAGLDAPSATPTSLPVSAATDETPSAIATGLRTPIASGPTLSRMPSPAMADGGCQSERVEGRQLADPERAEPGAPDLEGDVDRLLVRPVEPEREHAVDLAAHSIAVSACWPSRIRPGSSRDAALTWKCAVAVWASRKRRWSGESS